MDIKDVIYRASKLSNKEQQHILNILKANKIEYTKNANGYFFNFLKIDDDIIIKIIKCLELIEKNRDLVKEMDRRRNDLIKYYKTIIEEKLKISFEKRRNDYVKHLIIKKFSTNIYHEIIPILKIKRNKKFIVKDSIEAELILKEYLKAKTKYPKDSVYSRIHSNMKSNKRYIETKDQDKGYDYNLPNENDIDCTNDVEDLEGIEDLEDLEENVEIDEKEQEEFEEGELSDEYEGELLEENEDENKSEDSDENTQLQKLTKKKTNDEKTELEITYYKNILNQQGFVFDDNRRCFLIKESYVS